jgi:hypothetical protein
MHSSPCHAFVECEKTIRDGNKRVVFRIYKFRDFPGHCWTGIDDLEFNTADRLTADELAQCIFYVTGGSSGSKASRGETANYYVFYDEARPARLGLETKQGQRSSLAILNPFSFSPCLDTTTPSEQPDLQPC